jgi:hypothetical protein
VSVVDRIMSLEIEKACRTVHSTDRGDEGDSLATGIKLAGTISLHSQIDLLSHDNLPWSFRIWVRIELFAYCHEISLIGCTYVLTPKSFKIDSTDVTPARFSVENPVNLNKVVHSSLVIVLVAANVTTNIFLACGHSVVYRKGLTLVFEGFQLVRH